MVVRTWLSTYFLKFNSTAVLCTTEDETATGDVDLVGLDASVRLGALGTFCIAPLAI